MNQLKRSSSNTLIGMIALLCATIASASATASQSSWLTYYVNLSSDARPNTPPALIDEEIAAVEDTPLSNIDVLANASDLESDALRVFSVEAEYGSVTLKSGNLLDYTPPLYFSGQDRISYSVTDDQGGVSHATLTVNVAAFNDIPVAVNDSADVFSSGFTNTIDVLSNDTDEENDPLSIVSASALNGTVIINEDNTLNYAMSEVFRGSDVITYTITDGNSVSEQGEVSLNLVPLNLIGPQIHSQTQQSSPEDTLVTVTPEMVNITDPDSIDFTISVTRANDNFSVNENTLRPRKDYHGPIWVPVAVSDGVHTSDEFLLKIDITPRNDAPRPLLTLYDVQLNSHVTLNMTAFYFDPEAHEDQSLHYDFVYEFVDTSVQNPFVDGKTPHGRIEFLPANYVPGRPAVRWFNYTPDPGFLGQDAFSFFVYDETGARSTRGDIMFNVTTGLPVRWKSSSVNVGQSVVLENGSTDITECYASEDPTNKAVVANGVGVFSRKSDVPLVNWQCKANHIFRESFTQSITVSDPTYWAVGEIKLGEAINLVNPPANAAYCHATEDTDVRATVSNGVAVFEATRSESHSSWQCFTASDESLGTFTSELLVKPEPSWGQSIAFVGRPVTLVNGSLDTTYCQATSNPNITAQVINGVGIFELPINGVVSSWQCFNAANQPRGDVFGSPLEVKLTPKWSFEEINVGESVTLVNAPAGATRCLADEDSNNVAVISNGVATFSQSSTVPLLNWECFAGLEPQGRFEAPLTVKPALNWAETEVVVGQEIVLENAGPDITQCSATSDASILATVSGGVATFDTASASQLTSWQCSMADGEPRGGVFTSPLEIKLVPAWSQPEVVVGQVITLLNAGENIISCQSGEINASVSNGSARFFQASDAVMSSWDCTYADDSTITIESPLKIKKLAAPQNLKQQ